MRARVLKGWDAVRTSFWFVPALLAVAAIALSAGALALDRGELGRWVAAHDLGYGGGAEGASTMLETIAGSMITIAGVVFSMTLVALSLASTQFGPRLLRNFMGDRPNQVVLGVFIATFLYCILVLRAVRRPDEILFVPHLSVTLALALALASIGMLVYFIHHVSRSIQAEAMVARVGAEVLHGIERLFPERIGEEADPARTGAIPVDLVAARDARPIEAREEGYVQLVDGDALMAAVSAADVTVVLLRRPGDFVMRGMALARAWPPARVDEALGTRLRDCFAIGDTRTPVQDVAFSLQQLAEIAVRALSPSTNDPFTALACIDRLAAGLRQLAGRAIPPPRRVDEAGTVRVVANPPSFEELLAASFDPIRMHARSDALVLAGLLEALAKVGAAATRPEDMAALLEQAAVVWRAAQQVPEAYDRAKLQRAYEATLDALSTGRRPGRRGAA